MNRIYPILSRGIIGGNTAPILDSILTTGSGYLICPSETDQPAFMARMTDPPFSSVYTTLT